MRRILCAECALDKRDGERQIYAGGSDGPPEYERVKWGIAKQPTREQRTIRVNGVPEYLPMGAYTCDDCSADIKPGERCCAWSVWHDGGGVRPWEHTYIE